MASIELYKREYSEKMPLFFKLFKGIPPSVAQLEALRAMHRTMANRVKMATVLMVMLFSGLIYVNAFIDPGEHIPYEVFNPSCLVFLLPIVICVVMGYWQIRKLHDVVNALAAGNTEGLPAPAGFATEYLYAVRESGRDFLTRYEIVSLFYSDDCIGELNDNDAI
jgi:hypothetical protein